MRAAQVAGRIEVFEDRSNLDTIYFGYPLPVVAFIEGFGYHSFGARLPDCDLV
jgi:hypothetical protein